MVKVVDDFLNNDEFSQIQDVLLGRAFPWYYADRVNYINTTKDWEFQFTHIFYADNLPNSDHFNLLIPIINKLSPKSLIRIKANLITKNHQIFEYGYHLDQSFDCKSAIMYINTNNGYTLFETGEKIMSKENRVVLFDSALWHTGTSCTDEKTRVLINFNYF